ncbi:MAG: hypothetical protein HC913_08115 [Microscillaceae bacterium]|nr:hypothetical protein [Microscillaceae bacterium]
MTKRKKTFVRVLFVLGMGLIGGLMGYFLGKYLLPASNQGPSLPLYYKLALIPLFPLAIFLVIAAHELGHVMAGLAMRFQFSMLTIGPLMWQKTAPGFVSTGTPISILLEVWPYAFRATHNISSAVFWFLRREGLWQVCCWPDWDWGAIMLWKQPGGIRTI